MSDVVGKPETSFLINKFIRADSMGVGVMRPQLTRGCYNLKARYG